MKRPMKLVLLTRSLVAGLFVSQIQSYAVADGVCDPNGWCRLHFNLRNRPYSTVFIKPLDQYGQLRRVWMRADDFTDGVTVDCGRAMMSERNGTGMFFSATRGTVSGEIYESVCLGQNLQLGFPQGSGQGTWPQTPIYPQGSGGMMQPPMQQNASPSPLRTILEQLIK
jgi:hypothetical protein